ncbi:Sugar kinase of the NBD/HSP70 family, may contain an N-terminal HTH domain [Pseudarcicella hirudinis]|uniref:Sugar kinase of the NBD/HSP70 family, may contain an N-terminal HTH domain n=1 Tax=Pseudarcicella hirudinis TaxID=1079859 RepID=A0A1I5TYH6_9BACT|nr:ROK family protein [Pseudarcicella hirudinis]SFP88115.1 Sugar kinase of the NBD/HSP70 family, may contain an N-terminal HTH domain [Pseudarcicella hirudinis]
MELENFNLITQKATGNNALPLTSADVLNRESIVDIKKSRLKRGLLQSLYVRGNRTIAQLTRELNASVPSVTTLLEELIQKRWIIELGPADSPFGRKPILYNLHPKGKYTMLLDITTYGSRTLFFNLQNQVVYKKDLPLILEDNTNLPSKLIESFHQITRESGISASDIIAVGISMPGLINPKNGFNYTYKKLNPDKDSLGKQLETALQLPVYLINDTQATILGEHKFGQAKSMKNVLSVNMAWSGIGLGIVLNGKVFQGASGFAGELGHIQVKADGELCHCGKVGCLDTLTSASSLIRRIKERLRKGQISNLALKNAEKIDIEMIIDFANKGDALAIDLLHDIGKEMGKGLSIAVHLFNPEAIIINGLLAKAGKFISNPIEQAIHKYCLIDFKHNLSIEISALGENARLLGMQAYLVDQFLEKIA